MIKIPTVEIKAEGFSLKEFDGGWINIISETVWDVDTTDEYASIEDLKKCTGQDIGYSVEPDGLSFSGGRVYKIGEDKEKINIILACRCGFGVFEYMGQDYMFRKSPIPSKPFGIMAYQALKYQKINPKFVKNLADQQYRKITRRKMGKELYLKVIMSLGIVNEIDYEDSLSWV